jgi:metal-responsive CopG/Arc/MetJ family transcriptional regulator
MKVAVQFTIDEQLLDRIDRDPEVERDGRSAFLRRAAEQYLKRQAAARLREQYRRAYGKKKPFPDDYGPWPPKDLTWPEE